MITGGIAGFVAGTSIEDIPDEAIAAARDALIDLTVVNEPGPAQSS